MEADSLTTSRPISTPVATYDEINQQFDLISYFKVFEYSFSSTSLTPPTTGRNFDFFFLFYPHIREISKVVYTKTLSDICCMKSANAFITSACWSYRGVSCDVISSRICKSSYSRPPCWFLFAWPGTAKYNKMSYYFLFHINIPNYDRVTRILKHTLGWNFKSCCKVNQK